MAIYKTENKIDIEAGFPDGSLSIENTGRNIIFEVKNSRGEKAAAILTEYQAAELTAWLMKLF